MADENGLILINPEKAYSPNVFGQEQKIAPMKYGNFTAMYEFNATLQSSAVAGQAVGILAINPQLLARVIRQFYAVGSYQFKLGCTPADPTIAWSVWSDDILDFLAQCQELVPQMGGLAQPFINFRFQTSNSTFGAKRLKVFGIEGNTVLNDPKTLSSNITDESYNQNIVTFMSPVGLTLNKAIAIEADPDTGVGTPELVTVTIKVGLATPI